MIESYSIEIQNEKGMTLAELLVVLAVIAILAGLAFVGPEFIRSERITGHSRELLADLLRARLDAMVRSAAANSMGFGIRFVDNSSYTIFEFDDCSENSAYDVNGCAGDREEANTTSKTLSTSYELLVNGATPNNNILIFDKLGIPRDNSWALWNGTLRIKHQTDSTLLGRCISISLTRIREGVWNGSNCQVQ